MNVIIMAAGRASRMKGYGGSPHKALLEFNGEKILLRLIRQLRQAGFYEMNVVVGHEKEAVINALSPFDGLKIIVNEDYDKDKNIHSLLLGWQDNDESLLIVEGDIILSDMSVSNLKAFRRAKKSIWTVTGMFRPGQKGAIVKAKKNFDITDIKYVLEYSEEYSKYHKNLGITFIHKSVKKFYKELLDAYAARSWDYYFIDPWLDNFGALPCSLMDFGYSFAGSFNTPEEFNNVCDRIQVSKTLSKQRDYKITFVPVAELKHIEDYSRSRVEWLKEKILAEKVWTRPICVDASLSAVMDGQHRMEVAKRLGLKKIPAVVFDYEDVDVWSLRPRQFVVTRQDILDRVRSGNIYPYKTAKHGFPIEIESCNFSLEELLNKDDCL